MLIDAALPMNKLLRHLLLPTAFLLLGCGACHDIPDYEYTAHGDFQALWTIVDEHYCFFEEKDIDWNAVGQRYLAELPNKPTALELFDVCARMLDELRDGHVNLIAPFETSYYRKWWSDYPQNFDWRLIQEHYFNFDYVSGGGLSYKILGDNVGYVHYSSFSAGLGESFLDYMFHAFKDCPVLILDVRDNGGGNIDKVENLVSRFLETEICAGYILHKTGPGHDDFSEQYEIRYKPNMMHTRWLRPVILLTNRSTFSAANTFVAVMKSLPRVTVVGDVTGGGGGMPASYEIPVGWGVRMSGSPVLDPAGKVIEWGVEPTEGCRVDMLPEDTAQGIDTILEFAIALAQGAE